MNTTKYLLTPILILALFFSCHIAAKASPGDAILGFWEVKSDYYTAVYEIVKHRNQYLGKIHYYNDGDTVINSKNTKDNYVLEGIYYRNSAYTDGVMYGPDKEKYTASLALQGDTITAKMKVQGYPYTEYWTRKQ